MNRTNCVMIYLSTTHGCMNKHGIFIIELGASKKHGDMKVSKLGGWSYAKYEYHNHVFRPKNAHELWRSRLHFLFFWGVPQTGRCSRLLATGFRAGWSSANCLTITVGSFQHAFFTGAWLRTTNQNAITTFDYCNFEANTLGGIPMPDGWHMFIVIKTCLLQLVKIGWNTWALIKPCEIAPKYERWA